METSDSEYFESADEEFDGEENPTISPLVKGSSMKDNVLEKSMKGLSIDSSKPPELESASKTDSKSEARPKPNVRLGARVTLKDGSISSDEEHGRGIGSTRSGIRAPTRDGYVRSRVRKSSGDVDRVRSRAAALREQHLPVGQEEYTSWKWKDEDGSVSNDEKHVRGTGNTRSGLRAATRAGYVGSRVRTSSGDLDRVRNREEYLRAQGLSGSQYEDTSWKCEDEDGSVLERIRNREESLREQNLPARKDEDGSVSSDVRSTGSTRPGLRAATRLGSRGTRIRTSSGDVDRVRKREEYLNQQDFSGCLDDTSWKWEDEVAIVGAAGDQKTLALDSKLSASKNAALPQTGPKQQESAEEGDGWDWDEDDEHQVSQAKSTSVDEQITNPNLLPAANLSISPPKADENAWGWDEDDSWEPLTSKPNSEAESNEKDTKWSSWGNWGVTSLLSTATAGLSTVTSHVSQVLETGIGVPDPEELARFHKTQADKTDQPERPQSTFGFGNLVSGVNQITKLVESTSNKVIAGGLDTLETIGKKTMEVLQEGDPGLKKKRAFLHIDSNKPILSQMLREAKEKAETENKILAERHFHKKANYESLFDDHQGLVHLEALEMLSRQCDIKLQTILESLSGKELLDMQETLEQIKELCELPEEDEDKLIDNEELDESLNNAITEMNIPLTFQKLMSTWTESEQWLSDLKLEVINETELHEQSINILAQLTAIAVENFHKIGELLLVKAHRSTVDEADSLVQLTIQLTTLISHAAKKLSDKLNEKGSHSQSTDQTSEFITNVYYEAANSSSYIQNSFQLLLPILQVGVL